MGTRDGRKKNKHVKFVRVPSAKTLYAESTQVYAALRYCTPCLRNNTLPYASPTTAHKTMLMGNVYMGSGAARATSKVGGGAPTKKRHFLKKKGHLQWEISKRKYTIF